MLFMVCMVCMVCITIVITPYKLVVERKAAARQTGRGQEGGGEARVEAEHLAEEARRGVEEDARRRSVAAGAAAGVPEGIGRVGHVKREGHSRSHATPRRRQG